MTARDWPEVRLGDHVDLLTGFPFKSAQFSDDLDDVRLARGDNIVQGRFRWDGVRRWSRTDLDSYTNYLLEPGDVVLAMDRPWIEAGLKYAAVSPEDQPCFLVQRVSRLRGVHGLSTRFLRYVVGSRAFTEYVLAVQTGTAVPHISGRQIADFRFLLPPLAEQERIAETLGALDDKMDLNRRMNSTLESIAHAVFQSWFIDVDPECITALASEADLSGDWPIAQLADLVVVHRDSVSPDEIENESVDHYSIPAFDEGRMPSAEFGSTIKSNKFAVQTGSVLVSRLNPRIPRIWLPRLRGPRRGVCSTEFMVLSPRPPFTREYLYGLLCTDAFREELSCRVTGTSGSHQRVKPLDVMSIPVVLPPRRLTGAFSRLAAPLLEQVGLLREETRVLAGLRNALLPRLLDGSLSPSCSNLEEGCTCPNF